MISSDFQINIILAFHLEIQRLEEKWRCTEYNLIRVQCKVSEDLKSRVWSSLGSSSPKSVQLFSIFSTTFREMFISFARKELNMALIHTDKSADIWFNNSISVLD